MTTPAQWAELVTTALLGTDRRPLDAADPPGQVLHQAARHRILDRLAAPPVVGAPDPAEPPPSAPAAPTQDGPPAPEPADRLLDQLLRTPDPALISCWLGVCADRGYVVSALHWTTLARLAARSTGYDRTALGASLGPRGRWFLRQNPEWRRLAADAEPSRGSHRAGRDPPPAAPLTAEDVLAEPERLLDHPQPWGPDLVSAAYAVLGGEGQVPPAPHLRHPTRGRAADRAVSEHRAGGGVLRPRARRLPGPSADDPGPLRGPGVRGVRSRRHPARVHRQHAPASPGRRSPMSDVTLTPDACRPTGCVRTPRRRTPTSSPPWPRSTIVPARPAGGSRPGRW